MPPAFNLSQDQTLQFKVCDCLWQSISTQRNVHAKIDFTRTLHADDLIFVDTSKRERPHKLSEFNFLKEQPELPYTFLEGGKDGVLYAPF